MAMSKGTMSAIVVVVFIVAFVAGVYSNPFIFPITEEPEAPEDPIWADVLERGVIRVGSSPDWPPYEYLEDGEFTGLEVELTEIIAERLGLEVEWVEMGFDLIIPEIKDMAIDLGVSGFSVNAERLEVVQYIIPHSVTEGQIIILKSKLEKLGITEIESIKELDEYGITCGVQVGTVQQDELLNDAPESVRTYEDYLGALEDMKRGALDSIYAETPVTSWWILEAYKAGEEPIVVLFKRPYWPVAFVAHKDADILVAKMDGVLADIIADGTLRDLKGKWKSG